MKLYGTKDNVLLIDGDWVVNGNWHAIFDRKGNVVDCREYRLKKKKCLPFLMDVPRNMKGDYNEIIDKCLKRRNNEKAQPKSTTRDGLERCNGESFQSPP
jgi:hypothetical protein